MVKPGGIILVAYCMNEYSILTYGFKEGHMKESIRNQKVDDSFHVRSKEEDLYDYVRIEDIDAIDQAAGVKREKLIAADGPANYMRTVLNAMDEETYQLFIQYHLSTCERKDLLGQVRIHWILSESNKIIKSRRKYESDRRIEQKRRAVFRKRAGEFKAEDQEDRAGTGRRTKDIESMHEYYWENYTEMDQYGYEDYDNQQALLHRINANQEKLDLKHRFQKMLDSPFFGRVDFIYEGEEEAEPFYIGIGNFAQRTGATPLIYDWRAPVSSLFYDYDSGSASYEAPAGVLTGEIASKWQYKIKNGKMIYAFESDTKIDDEILKQELGSSGDVQLKNIVRTIQKEQNEIIRNTGDKILVIQGAAGSGKTSVALHRIAYLYTMTGSI